MKTVLLVPGFREALTSRDYKKVLKMIESKGYKAIFVPITWRFRTVEDWVKELEEQYNKYVASETILAGFSFGAVTAFVTAAYRNPSELWLCSLSPGPFSEDTSKSWQRDIGKARQEAFKKLDFNQLAAKISCKTLLFLGEKEARLYPPLEVRAKIAVEEIASPKLIRIPDCDHDITDDRYVAALKENI